MIEKVLLTVVTKVLFLVWFNFVSYLLSKLTSFDLRRVVRICVILLGKMER